MPHSVIFLSEQSVRAGEDVIVEAYAVTAIRNRLASWRAQNNPRLEHRIVTWAGGLVLLAQWLRSSVDNYVRKMGSREKVVLLDKYAQLTGGLEQSQTNELLATLDEFFGTP